MSLLERYIQSVYSGKKYESWCTMLMQAYAPCTRAHRPPGAALHKCRGEQRTLALHWQSSAVADCVACVAGTRCAR